MDYCPEIAILHGAFALVQSESKSGKFDLLQQAKGTRTSRPFLIVKDVVQEIIQGLEAPHGHLDRQHWSRCLHHIFFCKAFVFNKHFVSRETGEGELSKPVLSWKVTCLQIPDFHPNFYFDFSDEFGWTEFLREFLAVADLPTALNFTSHCLKYCYPEPALLHDLHLISVTLDFLVSACCAEILHQSKNEWDFQDETGSQSQARKDTDMQPKALGDVLSSHFFMPKEKFEELQGNCLKAAVELKHQNNTGGESLENSETVVEQESNEMNKENQKEVSAVDVMLGEAADREVSRTVDQMLQEKILDQLDHAVLDTVTKMTDCVTEMLALVQTRMSTKLFDRSSCKSSAMGNVLHLLGHIQASVIVFGIISASSFPGQQLREILSSFIVVDEDEKDVHSDDAHPIVLYSTKDESSASKADGSVNLVAEALLCFSRTAHARKSCVDCLSSFFTVPAAKGGPPEKLSVEKSVKFGRVLKLNLSLCKVRRALNTVKIVQQFSEVLADWFQQEKDSAVSELQACVTAILKELHRREKLAEEKRLNPSLTEVIEKVQKKLPRWKWCLQYGLAKRDLKGWWLDGFLDFLSKTPTLLETESDVRHLLWVLAEAAGCPKSRKDNALKLCAKLILKTFSKLPTKSKESIILDVYKDTESPTLPLVQNFDQSLTVTFNKLSANTSSKDLHGALGLGLHDPLTFTEHAVGTAISNQGQIPVVVKLLQLMSAVMKSVHPLHHPGRSLLCHVLHSVLLTHKLSATEQKNVLNLVSSLVQTYTSDVQLPPLLSPSEFLSSSVLPFISLHSPDPPVSIDFALRLLIGCLSATLCDRRSDWLEELHPAVIVVCCGGILQECAEMLKGLEEVDQALKIKELVLDVLEQLWTHFKTTEKKFEGRSLCWLQEKCLAYDWTVCTYLACFLAPSSEAEENLLLAEFATEAMKQATSNPKALLQLSAVSDAAAAQVLQAVQSCKDLLIHEAVLLSSLCQMLPCLLWSEVKRVVRVLSAPINAKLTNISLRCFLNVSSDTDFTEWQVELAISQLLMDSVILIISQPVCSSPSVLNHVSQVFVAAHQELLQIEGSKKKCEGLPLLSLQMFYHICVVMSAAPDIMLDPLFVLLLDILTRLTQLKTVSTASGPDVFSEFLAQGVSLIPKDSLRETLSKKLEP